MAGNMAFAFGALVAGGVVIDYGVKSFKAATASTGSSTGGGSTALSKGSGGFPAAVDPLPGAIGTRLDQGIDATGHQFLSPWAGKVVYSSASDAGWNGGGYVAVQSTTDASKVFYIAEGIVPTVKVGDTVTAGQSIAVPAINPYNGIFGNIEAGLANPANPGQPLAQVVSNAKAMVDGFYSWITSLGGPSTSNVSGAGHA